jgi:hypothetical protein
VSSGAETLELTGDIIAEAMARAEKVARRHTAAAGGLAGVRVREADRGPLRLWFIGTCRAEALPREDGPALPCGEGAAIQNQSHPLQAIRRAEKRLGFGDLLGDRRGVYDVLLELRATTRGSWVSP